MKKEIWLLGIVAVLCGALGVYFGLRKWETPPPSAEAAQHFFAQSLPDIHDNNEKMSNWQGKLLIVNFWATWCTPCVEEMPELTALQNSQEFKNLQIIGIGIDSPANIREFAGKHKISYPLYIAGAEGVGLSKKLGNDQGGLPFTLVFGADGQIRKTYLGRLRMETLRKDLASFS